MNPYFSVYFIFRPTVMGMASETNPAVEWIARHDQRAARFCAAQKGHGSIARIVTRLEIVLSPALKIADALTDLSTIALGLVMILSLAYYGHTDSARPPAAKKQAAPTVRPCACLWSGHIPGIL